MGEIVMDVVKFKKIRLNEGGLLEVTRKFDLEPANCPFAPRDEDGELCQCGDWCALFGEPEDKDIKLCHGRLITSDEKVIDDREESSEEEEEEGNIEE